MKAPVSTLGCVLAKTLAFWRVDNVIEVANLEVHFTGLVLKVWTAGVCKRRCLGTQDRHLAVRSVDTGHSVDHALLEKEAASVAGGEPLEHELVAEGVGDTLILAVSLFWEIGFLRHRRVVTTISGAMYSIILKL